MKKNIIDRISELPEFIVHHILSFLDSPAQLVRTSVLSKRWFALTASFPILDFDFPKFCRLTKSLTKPVETYENGYERDNFFKYVEYTISRFCQQNLSVHTFKLTIRLLDPIEVDIINRWVGLIFKKGVQVLVIDILAVEPLPTYRLPNILLSASLLTSLKICCCELPSSLLVDAVKFKYLKMLHLHGVPLSEELIKCLTSCCPVLEEFNVEDCYGFKRFGVLGHQNLQKVWICYDYRVERIDIEAPNLCSLSLTCPEESMGPPCMNLASCKKLTRLYYDARLSHTLGWLVDDISPNFPFLEHLTFDLPNECNYFKLSSPSLRTFVVNWTCHLDRLDMDTPNLVSFVCGDLDRLDMETPNLVSFVCDRSHVQLIPLKSRMECYPNDCYVGNLWFQKLRQFLEKNNGFKELKLLIDDVDMEEVEQLKMIQGRPFELEHVDLEPKHLRDLSEHKSVVDGVLWCCRPRSLTLESSYFWYIDFEEWTHLLKFIYEKLLQQEEDQGHTNIRFIFSSKSKMHFSNLNSLLKSIPRDVKEHKITFIKEKVV